MHPTLRKLFAAIALLGPAVGHAQLVNPGFETGTLDGWSVAPYLGGGFSQFIAPFDTTGSGPSLAAVFNVSNGSGPSGGVLLSQSFFTASSGLAVFSADIAVHEGGVVGTGSQADGGTFRLFVDGVTLDTFVTGVIGLGLTIRSHLLGSLDLAAGSHLLAIAITRDSPPGPGFPDDYVDNVSAVVSPVPEAPTLAMMGCGLLVIATRLRRRFARR